MDQPTRIECRHVVYCGKPPDADRDLHFVKEIHHHADGTQTTHGKLRYDFEREFYVTKKGFQKHTQKKELEYRDRTRTFTTTQANLKRSLGNALGYSGFGGDVRMLTDSPYVYGTDISSGALIKKQEYMDRYPGDMTIHTFAGCDSETDVVHGTGEIIMLTLTYKGRVFTACKRDFVKGYINIDQRAQDTFVKYLSNFESEKGPVDLIQQRGLKWDIEWCDCEIDVVKAVIQKAHEWAPDFLVFWNINFDFPKMIEACKRANVDPASLFSDPSVPHAYKFFRYKEGPQKKVTASGKETPIKFADQWHVVYTPAKWYAVDAMCIYRTLRVAKGEEKEYSLDYTLERNLGMRKLDFKEADHCETKLHWHQFMQTNYPFEYMVYNVFDCIGMELLDEKTTDVCLSFPSQCGYSDFDKFKSQPRRLVDRLHFEVQTDGWVYGATATNMVDEADGRIYDLANWIITLPAERLVNNGLRIIKENPNIISSLYLAVAD